MGSEHVGSSASESPPIGPSAHPPIRSAILAGGGATRFGGQPKGLERVGGERILDRLVAECERAFGAAAAPGRQRPRRRRLAARSARGAGHPPRPRARSAGSTPPCSRRRAGRLRRLGHAVRERRAARRALAAGLGALRRVPPRERRPARRRAAVRRLRAGLRGGDRRERRRRRPARHRLPRPHPSRLLAARRGTAARRPRRGSSSTSTPRTSCRGPRSCGRRIISVIGRKNAGKTTLAVALVGRAGAPEPPRDDHQARPPSGGRGQARAATRGATSTKAAPSARIIAAPSVRVLFERGPDDYDPIGLARRYLSDADLVLAEGYRAAPLPKIEVFRRAAGDRPIYDPAAPERRRMGRARDRRLGPAPDRTAVRWCSASPTRCGSTPARRVDWHGNARCRCDRHVARRGGRRAPDPRRGAAPAARCASRSTTRSTACSPKTW